MTNKSSSISPLNINHYGGDAVGGCDVEQGSKQCCAICGTGFVGPIEGEVSVAPKMIKQPAAPSVEEWVYHQLTHTPFRAWCPICVQAKAKNLPHVKRAQHR